MDLSKWRFSNIDEIGKNRKLDDKCRELYEEVDNSPIPIITDNLEFQTKIEQLAINFFVRGFKKSSYLYNRKIAALKYQRKVYQERIRGLEAMLGEIKHE